MMKKIIANVFAWCIPIIFFGVFIIGAIHGYKKHNVQPFSDSFYYSWYYGIETLWHKTDYKKLNDRVREAIYLTIAKPKSINPRELIDYNKTKEDFQTTIENLDKKEKEYINNGVSTFIDYMHSFQIDLLNTAIKFKETKIINMTQSEKTNTLSKKCLEYGLEKEIKDIELAKETISKDLEFQYKYDKMNSFTFLTNIDSLRNDLETKDLNNKLIFNDIIKKQ